MRLGTSALNLASSERFAATVAYPQDAHFIVSRDDRIEDQIGISHDGQHANVSLLCQMSHTRELAERLAKLFDPRDHLNRSTWIELCDIAMDLVELRKRPRGIADLHPRRRLKRAATSSSLAISPRSISSSARRISARSSSSSL